MNEYLYVTALGKFETFMKKDIKEKRIPPKVDEDWLSAIGYTDRQNDRRFVPILKELGFISDDGKPTQRYTDYRNEGKSKDVMEESLREAYSDLFSTYPDPFNESDQNISNFMKSKKNYSQKVADLARKTFKTLASVSGIIETPEAIVKKRGSRKGGLKSDTEKADKDSSSNRIGIEPVSIVISIQLVLPNTSDRDVYSNLFSELRKFILKEKQNEP